MDSRILIGTIYKAIRVVIRCHDGTDHTTYLDLSPTSVTLADLLLHNLDHDKVSCGPHAAIVDTVERSELAEHADKDK